MGHNWVLLKAGTDVAAFDAAALNAKDTGYIPAALSDEIIAHIDLLGPRKSGEVDFKAPTAPGEYPVPLHLPGPLPDGHEGLPDGQVGPRPSSPRPGHAARCRLRSSAHPAPDPMTSAAADETPRAGRGGARRAVAPRGLLAGLAAGLRPEPTPSREGWTRRLRSPFPCGAPEAAGRLTRAAGGPGQGRPGDTASTSWQGAGRAAARRWRTRCCAYRGPERPPRPPPGPRLGARAGLGREGRPRGLHAARTRSCARARATRPPRRTFRTSPTGRPPASGPRPRRSTASARGSPPRAGRSRPRTPTRRDAAAEGRPPPGTAPPVRIP